jgi:DNA helicase-2/ATP-dependent DNA helicase PcrA
MPDAPRLHIVAPTARQLPGAPATLAPLNVAQAEAAHHAGAPLLIVAGAGSGKTKTLVHRVATLISRGTPPARLLLLTFTRRAAQEMLGRCERLVGPAARDVQGGTFHGTAHRLLRRFGPAAGLPADFTILDQSDATDLMGLSRSALGYGDLKNAPRSAPRFPRAETLVTLYSRQVNTDRPVDDLLSQQWPHFLAWAGDITRCFTDYVQRKAERHLLDYDDLLLSWALLLEQAPPIAEAMRGLFDHVLVDEYQDTNPLQARILRSLCTSGALTVVGDDAQSIYAFRGATIRNILDFPHQFPGTRIVTLEQNYRSTSSILETTNVLISRSSERYSKQLVTDREAGERPWLVTVRDDHAQTQFVVERILELHEAGTPLREMAVLVRAGFLSADLEIELTNRHLPYEKWGGLKFLEAAHIKDVLAFLRVLENPRDEVSWYRLLRLLPGVGDATARAAIELLAQHQWAPLAIGAVKAPARARPGLQALGALLDGMMRVERGAGDDARKHGPGESLRLIRVLYDPILQATYDDAPPRMADLDQLETIAAGYPDRTTFLAALALEPPAATQDLAVGSTDEDDALVISTVHSAKGKEWDVVFVIHATDGVFPMARAAVDEAQVDEERRLLYVAMTRARNELYVTHPLASYASRMGADFSYTQLSRFLDEGVRRTMQRVTVGDVPQLQPPPEMRTALAAEPVVDLRALLRGRLGGG